MPSRCNSPFIVENVNEMDFIELEEDDFTTKHDHAKWAISLDKKRPYVCVGDINRMDTQRKRGGGTLCFQNPAVWKTFKAAIKVIEECPRGSSKRRKSTKVKPRKLRKLKARKQKKSKKRSFWEIFSRHRFGSVI